MMCELIDAESSRGERIFYINPGSHLAGQREGPGDGMTTEPPPEPCKWGSNAVGFPKWQCSTLCLFVFIRNIAWTFNGFIINHMISKVQNLHL